MKIKIVAVGKLKDDFNSLGVSEYMKRIKRFCDVEIKEVQEENFVKMPNNAEIEKIKKLEGDNIEKELTGAVIVLDIQGKQFDSVNLSKEIDKLFLDNSSLTFVIGGSYGIDDTIKNKAKLRLSFSNLTFPHGLFRVMLLEQIYRSFAIRENTPYHK